MIKAGSSGTCTVPAFELSVPPVKVKFRYTHFTTSTVHGLCNPVYDGVIRVLTVDPEEREIFRNQTIRRLTAELAQCITQVLSSLETNKLSYITLKFMQCYPATGHLDIRFHATLFLVTSSNHNYLLQALKEPCECLPPSYSDIVMP